MSDRRWLDLPEGELEAILSDSLPETPPAGVVQAVTPWRQAMHRVLLGTALTCVTLNFWWLNYLLPFAGAVLSLLGFRALRLENRWFRAGWWLRVCRMLVLTVSLSESAFVGDREALRHVLTALTLLTELGTMVCLWRALCTVRGRVGLPPSAPAAGALAVWYTALCLLAFARCSGLVIPIAMLAAYGFILRNLYRVSRQTEEAGYAIRSAPVRLSDAVAAALAAGLCLAGILSGYLFGGKLPMEWTPMQTVSSEKTAPVRQHLLELGFPATVLQDLTEEELLACSGALRVVTDVREAAIDRGRETFTEENGVYHYYNVYDEHVRITGVGVLLPGERERWRIFHHFEYLDGVKFRGTECVQLWPAYRMNEGWTQGSGFAGRVLYESEGNTYAAPFASFGSETYTTSSVFWGESTQSSVFAEFSMPAGGIRHRGYLSYEILESIDGYIVDAWINLTHQWGRWQYPVRTAKQSRMENGSTLSSVFRTVQDALQFSPEYHPMDGEFTVITGEES